MKYDTLVNVLDRLREEATPKWQQRYLPHPSDVDKIATARSWAFIHLYLKVSFGLLHFDERVKYITDGSYDGGIDGYYIDSSNRTIYLIQAKFRTKAYNFENKPISLEEVLVMDITRIAGGEEFDEQGNPYNGKIKQLQREIRDLPDVGRYSYQVVILANLTGVSDAKLRQLTGGYAVEVVDHEKCYEKLVFPVLSGTYFNATDLNIPIDLSNKNAGSKISYTVKTRISECEITVLFVPTLEIAKIMDKYKNSLLKYNPRSYLEFEGKAVNQAIRETITETETNEFALFNNGITMLSDETFLNEKIGQKNRAQLTVTNPQIINGGQTSYTLSRLYRENIDSAPEKLFGEKEVLLKVITLLETSSDEDKVRLIEEISNATNKQTPVINADRYANELFHKHVQKKIFKEFGLLYERKRGEFADGLNEGYVSPEMVVERNLFLRIYYAANGKLQKAIQKRLFQKNTYGDIDLNDDDALDRFFMAYHVFRVLVKQYKPHKKIGKDIYGKVFAYVEKYFDGSTDRIEEQIATNFEAFLSEWKHFINEAREKSELGRKAFIDKATGERRTKFMEGRYYANPAFAQEISSYFRHGTISHHAE